MAESKKMLYEERDLKNGVWEMGVALPFINTDFNTFEKKAILQDIAYNNSIFVYGDVTTDSGVRPGDLCWIGPSTSNAINSLYKGTIRKLYISRISYDSITKLSQIIFELSVDDYFDTKEFNDGDLVTFCGLAYGWNYTGIYYYTSVSPFTTKYTDTFVGDLTNYRIAFNNTSSNNDRFERVDPLFDKRKFSQRICRFGELNADRLTGFCVYCVNGYPSRNGGSPDWGRCGITSGTYKNYTCNGDPTVIGSQAKTCRNASAGYTSEITQDFGMTQSLIKNDRTSLNELKNAVLRISTWFKMIPEKDFNNGNSVGKLKIELYNYNSLIPSTGSSEYSYLQTGYIYSTTPNYFISTTMPVGGYSIEEYEELDENGNRLAYSYYSPITPSTPDDAYPLRSVININLTGKDYSPCKVNCDIQFFIVEHAKDTSQEACGYFKTNTPPDIKEEEVTILSKSFDEVELSSGRKINFDVQGGNEKFQIKATWSNENLQFVNDMKVLEDWSNKGWAIVLRTQQFEIVPPVLFTRLVVESKIMKNTRGLEKYIVEAVFTEI